MRGVISFSTVVYDWFTGRSWAKQLDGSRFSFPHPNLGFRNDAALASTRHYFIMAWLCFVRKLGLKLNPALQTLNPKICN